MLIKNITVNAPEEVKSSIKMPVYLFLISLAIGTLLLLLHFAIPQVNFLVAGFIYLLIAAAVNIIMFGCLVIYSFVYWKYKWAILLHACLLLVNIPIAVVYIYIIFEFSMSNQF